MATFPYPPNSAAYDPASPYHAKEQTRATGRTPSPTPSEAAALKTGVLDWKTMANWRFWFRREWLCSYQSFFVTSLLLNIAFRVLCRSCDYHCHHSPYHHLSYTNCALVDTSNEMVVGVSGPTTYPPFNNIVEMNTNMALLQFEIWLAGSNSNLVRHFFPSSRSHIAIDYGPV
jgi:hypothetical protein